MYARIKHSAPIARIPHKSPFPMNAEMQISVHVSHEFYSSISSKIPP